MLISTILSFFGINSSNMSNTLKVFLGNDLLAPYEFKSSSSTLGMFNVTVFGHILNSDETQEILPGIVKKWNFDQKDTYTFVIGNSKFHNGREVTALDFEFSIVRGFISKEPNYNKFHYESIEGIEKLKVGDKFRPNMVSGIKIIDSKTLQIKIIGTNPTFLINFTNPFAPIVPIEELEDDYYTWKTKPIGAGPYRVLHDYKNDVIVLEKVSPTADGAKLIELHTQRKNVDYDILFENAVKLEKENGYKTNIAKNPFAVTAIFFFRKNELSKNQDFRKALYHSINRDTDVGQSMILKPAYEMMIKPYMGRVKPKNPYNFELAKEYAKKLPAHYFEKPIKIGVYSSNTEFPPSIRDQLDAIKKDLESTGMKFIFEPLTEKHPTPDVMKKYVAKISSKNIDLADPILSYGAMSKNSPYENELPDSNGDFDKAYIDAVSATSFESRLEPLNRIAKIIEDQALIVPIFERYARYRTNPKAIKSLGNQSKPHFLDLTLVELK